MVLGVIIALWDLVYDRHTGDASSYVYCVVYVYIDVTPCTRSVKGLVALLYY